MSDNGDERLSLRFRAVLSAAALVGGAALALALAWAFVLGPLRTFAWMMLLPTASSLLLTGGVIFAVSFTLGTSRRRAVCRAIAFTVALQGTLPMLASAVGSWQVRSAQRFCMEAASAGLSSDAGLPASWLERAPAIARPGFSVRYAFRLSRDADEVRCTFPDALGARVSWHGTSHRGGPWHFEALMD